MPVTLAHSTDNNRYHMLGLRQRFKTLETFTKLLPKHCTRGYSYYIFNKASQLLQVALLQSFGDEHFTTLMYINKINQQFWYTV